MLPTIDLGTSAVIVGIINFVAFVFVGILQYLNGRAINAIRHQTNHINTVMVAQARALGVTEGIAEEKANPS